MPQPLIAHPPTTEGQPDGNATHSLTPESLWEAEFEQRQQIASLESRVAMLEQLLLGAGGGS
jgi:hypothetical protein